MWDLDTLVQRNNEVSLEYMMNGQKQDDTTYAKPPGGWSLTVLGEKLRSGPPSLSSITNYFSHYKSFRRFSKLVRKFLPEYEQEIMRAPLNQKVYVFNQCFNRKYYKLPLNTSCSLEDLCTGIPVELFGMSYHAYHNLDMRPGYLLLLSLVIYPFEGDERDDEDDAVPFDPARLGCNEHFTPTSSDTDWLKNLVESLAIGGEWIAPIGFRVIKRGDNNIELVGAKKTDEVKETIRRTLLIAKQLGITASYLKGRSIEEKIQGAKIALLDKVQGIIGNEIVSRIPLSGWTWEEMHALTDNTRFDGCGDFAAWACGKTGCISLDYNFENGEYIEGYSEPIFKWTGYNIKALTEQYPKVRELRRKIDHLVEWLELDPLNNFRDLLGFLLDKSLPKKRKPIAYRDFNYIPLDQASGEEDEEDEGGDGQIITEEEEDAVLV
jgi:hypothetical protein